MNDLDIKMSILDVTDLISNFFLFIQYYQKGKDRSDRHDFLSQYLVIHSPFLLPYLF